jgi:dihydroxyacetone synthase
MAPSLEVFEQVVNNDPIAALKAANDLARSGIKIESPEKHDKVLKVFRAFIADLCQQFNGGHPG